MSNIAYQGYLEKCPQKSGIGKSWNKRYFVLKRADPLGNARLEYYPDINSASKQQKRSIIPLSEVTSVQQTTHKSKPFVFDITTPMLHYRLAATSQRELHSWIDTLSDLAFADAQQHGQPSRPAMHPPMNYQTERPMMSPIGQPPPPYMPGPPPPDPNFAFSPPVTPRSEFPSLPRSDPTNRPPVFSGNPRFQPTAPGAPVHGKLGIQTREKAASMRPDDNPFLPSAQDLGIQENTLYSGLSQEKRYGVCIIPTDTSERLALSGEYYLLVSAINISLESVRTGELLYTWPMKYLRRYGRDFTKFTFEAGRKCESGPGVIFLGTELGNEIFHEVHANVKAIGSQQHTSLKQEDIRKPQGFNVSAMKRIVTMPPVRQQEALQPEAPVPAPRPMLRTQSDLGQMIGQPRLSAAPLALPPQRFVQEVITQEQDTTPEHFYEVGGDTTLDRAVKAATDAAQDVMQAAVQVPSHRPKTSTSHEEQKRKPGYDRLVLKDDDTSIPDEQKPEPLYDEAELDSLMANIAQHTRISGAYDTLFRDFTAAAADPEVSKPSVTIDDDEVAQLDNLWQTLEASSPYEQATPLGLGSTSSSRYDYLPHPKNAKGMLPPYDNVEAAEENSATAVENGIPPYQNVSPGMGHEEKRPGYVNVTAESTDDIEMSETEELGTDDYTPLEEGERIPAHPPRVSSLDTELDDPEYGVPKITHL